MPDAPMLSIRLPRVESKWGKIPPPTEWQHIGNEIKAAFIPARMDFVNVSRA
jgi:hypothetical protein